MNQKEIDDIKATNAELRSQLSELFAKKLVEQIVHDPNGKTSRRPSKSYSLMKREEIDKYLASPSSNEKELRNSSIYLYQINTRYRGLINYYANIPCWLYVITPAKHNPSKAKRDAYQKQYQKACNYLESICVQKTSQEIAKVVLREGVYFGCVWSDNGGYFILQKLNPDYCSIVSFTEGGICQFKYDMSKIQEKDLETYYPPEFQQMYQNYKKTGISYQPVPPEISVCVKADPTIIEYSIPPFAGTFPSLYQLENIKTLNETSSELSNYKLMLGKLPLDKEGQPLLTYQQAMQYYNHVAKNVGERVGVAISPFDWSDHKFEQSGSTAQIDEVARASENYFSEAGTTAMVHGATNSTSGVTKLAIKVDEAFAFSIMYQIQNVINRLLKLTPGTVKFKIRFLDVSCFNRDEKINELKSSMNYGIGALEYCAVMGIPQYDILGERYVEKEILDVDNLFSPMKTASTRSSQDDTQQGRPTLSDEDISDEGEETRDGTKDDNR